MHRSLGCRGPGERDSVIPVTETVPRHLKVQVNIFERRIKMSENKEAMSISCASIMPGCPFTASAATEAELLNKVAAHAANVHKITEISPELAAKVKAAIKSR